MLKPAQLYEDKLREEFISSWYKPENIYYNGWAGQDVPELPNNNYGSHHFVSIDDKENILGYISYSVDWNAMSAYNMGIISFRKGSVLFGKDVYEAICNLFEKYNMNRVSWYAYVENPAIRGYENFIKKHGGRRNAYHRQKTKLQDGKLHDSVEFEILASEFRK